MTVATQTTTTAPLSATVEAMRQAHAAALKQIAEARQSLLALIGDDAPLATEMQALNATVAAVNAHIAEQVGQVQALVAGVQANFAGAAQTIAQALTGMTGTASETNATTQTPTPTELGMPNVPKAPADAVNANIRQADVGIDETTPEEGVRVVPAPTPTPAPEDDDVDLGDDDAPYIPFVPSEGAPPASTPDTRESTLFAAPRPASDERGPTLYDAPAPTPAAKQETVTQAANAAVTPSVSPELAAALAELRRNSKRSNRKIGEAAGVSRETVRKARGLLAAELAE